MKQSPCPSGSLNTGIYCRGTSKTTFPCMLPFRENREKLASNGSTKRQDPCGNNPLSRLQYKGVQDPGGEASMSAGLQSTRDPPWDVGQGLPEQEVLPLLRASTPSSAPPMSLLQCLSTVTSLLAASTALPLIFCFCPCTLWPRTIGMQVTRRLNHLTTQN